MSETGFISEGLSKVDGKFVMTCYACGNSQSLKSKGDWDAAMEAKKKHYYQGEKGPNGLRHKCRKCWEKEDEAEIRKELQDNLGQGIIGLMFGGKSEKQIRKGLKEITRPKAIDEVYKKKARIFGIYPVPSDDGYPD